jgi:hypothetical protein
MSARRAIGAPVAVSLLVLVSGCANGISATAASATGSPITVSSATVQPGSSNATASAASSSPSPTASEGAGVVYLTAADSGSTVTVAIGARIEVRLDPNGGSYDPPTVDNSATLAEQTHDGGYPANTTAFAQFQALAAGTAQISSQTDLACLHTTPRCLPPQREFRVTIAVR